MVQEQPKNTEITCYGSVSVVCFASYVMPILRLVKCRDSESY